MDYVALKAELVAGHPITGAYSDNDSVAADQLNVLNRTRNRESLSGSEILQAIDKAEFNALTAADKQLVWDLLHLGTLNPFGVEAALFINAFGGSSATIAALGTERVESISRAAELGLEAVYEGHVQYVREMP